MKNSMIPIPLGHIYQDEILLQNMIAASSLDFKQ
jgi:hypothetical protein